MKRVLKHFAFCLFMALVLYALVAYMREHKARVWKCREACIPHYGYINSDNKCVCQTDLEYKDI